MFFCEDLIEQRQIVEPGKIGHLPAEEAIVKGLLGGGSERGVQGIKVSRCSGLTTCAAMPRAIASYCSKPVEVTPT